MKNVVHKIYHLTFPCGKDYVGSTSTPFNMRYGNYRNDYKISKTPITQISISYRFKEVKMVEVDRIECPMYDSRITILEEEWKQKLNPSLNVRKAHQTKEERLLQMQEYSDSSKEYRNKHILEYNKTTKGKLNTAISSAKNLIKNYTKQNKPNMVKKWEGILKERIQNRLDNQSS